MAIMLVLMVVAAVAGFFDSVATGIAGASMVGAFFLTLPIGDE